MSNTTRIFYAEERVCERSTVGNNEQMFVNRRRFVGEVEQWR